MKFIIAQILTAIYLVREIRSLDLAHHYHGVEQQEQEHQKKPVIPILKYISERDDKGWKYSYESGNGIQAEEAGYIKNLGDEKHESVVQQGSVTYHDEHGHPITLTYIADEHGFRAQGEHLPTSPPIPEAIQKSLEQGHHEEETEPPQENQEEYEGKAEYGQESQTHGQAQSYVETQSHGLKQSYNPAQSQGSSQSYVDGQSHVYSKPYGQATYSQPTYKYPQSYGLNKRQQYRY